MPSSFSSICFLDCRSTGDAVPLRRFLATKDYTLTIKNYLHTQYAIERPSQMAAGRQNMRADVPQRRQVLPVAQEIHRLVAKCGKGGEAAQDTMNTTRALQGEDPRDSAVAKKADHQAAGQVTISVQTERRIIHALLDYAADPVAQYRADESPGRRIALYPRIPGISRRPSCGKISFSF